MSVEKSFIKPTYTVRSTSETYCMPLFACFGPGCDLAGPQKAEPAFVPLV